jgi:hypothetical protein
MKILKYKIKYNKETCGKCKYSDNISDWLFVSILYTLLVFGILFLDNKYIHEHNISIKYNLIISISFFLITFIIGYIFLKDE